MIWLLALLSTLAAASPDAALKDRIERALSHRDGGPACEVVAKWGPSEDVAAIMRGITERVTMPPWLPMRAAKCVVLDAVHDTASWSLVEGWMSGENTAGFALVATQNVDRMNELKAVKIADLAVKRSMTDPRFARMVTPHLKGSRHVAVTQRAAQLTAP